MSGNKSSLSFVGLNADDSAEIAALLNATWPQLYGQTGCPHFSEDMLRWLYGGPDATAHHLIGCRDPGGRLVGFKAALYRHLQVGDHQRPGHVLTHLAIAPDLNLPDRMAAAAELSQLHTLARFDDAICLAFFESDKAIARNVTRLARKAGLHLAQAEFRQAIVNPRRLKAGTPAPQPARKARQEDAKAISAMLAARSDPAIRWTPTVDALWWHLAQAPDATIAVCETADGLSGVMAGYTLRLQKAGQVTPLFICELLLADDPRTANSLLRHAMDAAEKSGLRGLVIENATYLPDDTCRNAGILLSPRNMTVMLRSKAEIDTPPQPLICDVK